MRRRLRHQYLCSLLVLLLMVFFNTAVSFGADALLAWDAPATNSDGTALADLNGYIVYYGTSTGSYSQSVDVGNVTAYSVTGLSDGATYYFAVSAYDTSGNESTKSNEITKTIPPLDVTAPVLSAIQSGSITYTTAAISWTTNEAADTQIEYGTTTSYGSSTTLDSTMTTSHTQTISNLTAAMVYHYRVLSTDASGNQAVSGDNTFSTLALPDTTAPGAPLALRFQ